MAFHATVNAEPDGFSCLTCGVTCEHEGTVVATLPGTGPFREVIAGDLVPDCEGLNNEHEAHHFAPTAGGIACQWCAVEITPVHEARPFACVREQ